MGSPAPATDSLESWRESLRSLTEAEKAEVKRGLAQRVADFDDTEAELLLTTWELWARPSQLEPEGDWVYWLLLAGRGYGKTRGGAEWVRDSVKTGRFELVNLIGATADDARDIMIEGESGILACCPRWERPEYLSSKRRLDWPNGAKSLIFTADEPERLRGKQHQRLWADEIAAWRYEESWTQAKLGLRLPPDPRAVITSTPKPRAIVRDLLARPRLVISRGSTYENRENLAPAFYEELIAEYEGTRLGRQELEAELLLDEGLAYRFSEHVHCVPAFDLPDTWDRFECMDFGSTNPTAWLAVAVDHDGNLIVFDEYYEPGLPSQTAPEILERRRALWKSKTCYSDPSVYDNRSVTNRWGQPATVAAEFAEHGVNLTPGNRDRVAGYVRISELLKVEETRMRPAWAGPGVGSPKLFIVDRCRHVIEQLQDAPLEEPDEPHPGEAVSRRWEGPHGHAHAALRYGVMSWPGASRKPEPQEPEDPRAALLWRVEQKRKQTQRVGRYVDV